MIALNDLLLLISEGAIVALGGLLVYVSAKAYRRERSISMLAMSIGFAVIVVGSLIEEIFLEVFRYQLVEAHTLENLAVAIGLLILVYSIYGARG
jgi:branched-subunit amino acid ABC-type transport system permease component